MATESQKLVVFTLEDGDTVYEYGIPIKQVYEITRPQKTTKLPGMPLWVDGVINLRGNVIPIIDIKKRFCFSVTVAQDTTRVIVVTINGKKCGVLVDDVLEIIPVAAENIDEVSAIAGGISANFIIGIGKVDERLIIALDMDKILTEGEEKELQRAV